MSSNVNTLELPADLRELKETQSSDPDIRESADTTSAVQVLHRDPSDVRTILSLASTGMLLVLFKRRAPVRQEPRQESRTPFQTVAPTPPVALVQQSSADYLSGEANVSVKGNMNPIIRLGLSPNGVTMIEFPVADRFFAIHPGNSDLVTIDDSPTKATDHFLVMRAGSGFASPTIVANAGRGPATSIIVQMQSGMVIPFLIYPVQYLSQQGHRCVVGYDRNEVISARRAAGLAVNLDGTEQDKAKTASSPSPQAISVPV